MTGGCLCGAIRYQIAGTPVNQTVCHCAGCRRASAAPAVAWMTVRRDSLQLAGALKYVRAKNQPKNTCDGGCDSKRGFCPECGTQITFEDSGRADEVDVTAGTLDDATAFAPREDVFDGQRLPWVRPFAKPEAARELPQAAAALQKQYHAALAMLKQAIELCPDELWCAGASPFWKVAYHALYFTHLYLQPSVQAFQPWEHHRKGDEQFGAAAASPQSRERLLEYWRFCDAIVDNAVARLDLGAKDCGFHWYKLPKLEHQINNIRHLQHHAALLAGRLRQHSGADVKWLAFK